MTARPPGSGEQRPSELLVAATAAGLWAYSRSAFHVEVLTTDRFHLRPGRLLLAAHRGSGDVPILCGTIYFRGGLWAERGVHLHFGARDDYFERGFLAGYPRSLPVALRRLFYPVVFGPGLERVRVHPLRSAHRMKLAQLLAALPPSAELEPLLPAKPAEALRRRAERLGRRPPRTAHEALRGSFADILWRTVTEEDVEGPDLGSIWQARAAAADADLGALIELVRAGEPLLFFPEGRHSPDGAVGPLVGHGLARLVEEGVPESVQYVAIAYDPLTPGRPRALVASSDARPAPRGDVEAAVLGALRETMPLSCGQVVAHELVVAASAGRRTLSASSLEGALAAAASGAAEEGRALDPALGDTAGRRRRIGQCLAALRRRRLVGTSGGSLVLDPPRLRGDATLRWLGLEYASSRQPVTRAGE